MRTKLGFDALQRVIAALPRALLVVDGREWVAFANRAVGILLELPHERITGRRLIELMEPARSGFRELLAASRRRRSTETVSVRVRGKPRASLRLTVSLIEDGEPGDELFLLQLVADRTGGQAVDELSDTIRGLRQEIRVRESREAERRDDLENERRARSQAEEAARLKDEFLATVSHELRTPLHAVMTWAELLHDQLPIRGNGIGDAVDAIRRNAHAQSRLVNDLLDLSRIATGRLQLMTESVDLREAVTAALDAVRPAAEERGVGFEIVLPEHLPAIDGDQDRIRQVLWNLLSNAVKFSHVGATVELAASVAGPWIEVAVTDHGVGMAQELLPYVFDSFRQGDATSTRRHGGLGLGLAIVRHLVELHGGRVSAWSDGPGTGATFRATFRQRHHVPGAADPPPKARDPQPKAARPGRATPLSGISLVLIDDHPDSRVAMERLLRMLGARVESAGSSSEGLQAVARTGPDVVLSDLEMPEEDGFTFVRRLRALDGDRVPAAALTAYASRQDRDHAIAAGFDRYLAKPLSRDELVSVITDLAGCGDRA